MGLVVLLLATFTLEGIVVLRCTSLTEREQLPWNVPIIHCNIEDDIILVEYMLSTPGAQYARHAIEIPIAKDFSIVGDRLRTMPYGRSGERLEGKKA